MKKTTKWWIAAALLGLALLLFGLALLLFVFARNHITVLGDTEEINASIYIDDRLVGKMKRSPYKDSVYAVGKIWPLMGIREMRFVSDEGQVLKKRVYLFVPWESSLVYLSFKDKRIEIEYD